MIEKTDEELMQASPEDWAIYNRIAAEMPNRDGVNGDNLDKFGVPIPYASGPHIIRHFRDTLEIVKPTNIFEIGLNYGISSSYWLDLSDATIFSCDISYKDETVNAAAILTAKYPERFTYRNRLEVDFQDSWFQKFELCFLDGGHDEEDVTKDIQLCKDMLIPYILFDDWYFRFGPGVKVSVEKFPELELVKDMDNLRLYKFKQ